MSERSEEPVEIKPSSVMGFNGHSHGGMIIHPDCQHIVYHLGYIVVVENISTKKQSLLFGHHNDADIIVWDYEKKDIYCRFTLHKVKVQALDISPNDLFLLSLGGQDDGNVVVWNINKKDAICGSPAQSVTAGITLCCKFTHTNDYSFITAGEYCLRIWSLDVKNRKIRPTEVNLGPYKRIIQCLDIENDDSLFYCGTTTGDILCVIMKTAILVSIGPPKKIFSMGVKSLCHITTGGQLQYLVGAGDGTVAIVKDRHSKFLQTKFNFAEFSCILLNTGHSSSINDIIFPYATSDLFLTCGKEEIRVWHASSEKEMLRITVSNMTCNALDISRDGSIIISAWNDGRIRAHYPETGKLMYQIENAHNRGVTSIAFSADSDRIISGGGEGQCACIYPDNCQIITSGTDRNVGYWEVTDGTQIRELEAAKSGSVNAMDISKDGKYFITGGGDHLIKVWLYEEGVVTHIGVGHGGSIKRVKISPDQTFVISVGEEGAILRWPSPFLTESSKST
ncbi:ciliaflagella52-likeassociated and flagella-associated 52 [Octopus vulgaris]|uniref:Cilia- and flagella-associated protein 52 n=1 Tax=Octopus vulgaris TaxID=6645 RepID=A0AA36BIE1_OCTVU|nr:ciliaflagella52-likeassociated and flagella-associated 52 [Octopus vulgaris]